MACRTVLRSVFLSEQWRPASSGAGLSCSSSSAAAAAAATPSSSSFLRSLPRLSLRSRSPWGLLGAPLRCSHGEGGPDSSSLYSPGDLDPPQEAVLKAISEVSKSEGRVSQTTNVVMGGTVTDDSTNEWLALDQKGHVTHKLSSGGKYVSVNIGPIRVISSEQVQAIYNAMKRDDRMKYFL